MPKPHKPKTVTTYCYCRECYMRWKQWVKEYERKNKGEMMNE